MKRKLLVLLFILGLPFILSADLLDKIQHIDSLEQQGKYAQAEKEARALLADPTITPSERASVQNILADIARKKATQSQQTTEQPSTTGTEGVPGEQVQLGADGQPIPAIPAGPATVDTGTLQVTSKDDVSDGSKFKTYNNYEKAILAKPTPSSIYSLCNLYFKDGLYERAVKLAKKDASKDVRNLFVIAIGSRLYGDFDESINAYNEILALSPGNAEANLGLGIAYKSKGDFSKAINYLQRYLNVRPDAEVSREIGILSEALNNK